MTFIDNFLNRITMYRLVAYYLFLLLVLAAVFGFFDILPYSPTDLAFSTALILGTGLLTNTLFAKVFQADTNVESVYITGLILALLITPVAPNNYSGIAFLIFASVWAMASKYILALGKKHLFNPAAFGITLGAFALGQGATWWAGGNYPLLPFVVIGGLLIVRKIHRFDLALSFLTVSLLTITLTATGGPLTAITQTLTHSAIFFFAFVMLTEPLTMPPSRWLRIAYGALVGILFAPNVHLGSLYFSPELALLVGNVFVYIVSPKGRFVLTLKEKRAIALDTFEFVFTPDRKLLFSPGQYVEWTLPHERLDTRGNRRFFTIASTPTEDVVCLGVKFYTPTSSFKSALKEMRAGNTLSVSQIAGDFTLPRSREKKLAFIAGGIGITPFRSMVQHLLDTHEARSVILLYSNKVASEIAYKEVFDRAAQEIGMKTVYALTNESASVPGIHSGFIDATLIAREVPDYKERIFYISGPHSMTETFTKTLQGMGVSRFNIKTDYFPGFA